MYDLNLSVPNITAQKYTTDNRFLLLKNYLYELNEVLSLALDDKTTGEIESVKETIENQKNQEKQTIIHLKNDSKNRFDELEKQILSTAEELAADYTTAISAVASKNEELSAELDNHKKSNNAQFTLQGQELLSLVENTYFTKTELTELEEELASKLSQTADSITEGYSEGLSLLGDDLGSVEGELQEFVSSFDVYIRRGELEEGIFGIEIGRSDSNIKARFTNERLSFFQGFTEVAYISGNKLCITRAEILDYLKIGNGTDGFFTFDVSENGLEVIWSDGN